MVTQGGGTLPGPVGAQAAGAEESCLSKGYHFTRHMGDDVRPDTKETFSRHFNGRGMLRGAKWVFVRFGKEMLPCSKELFFLCLKIKISTSII